MTSQNWSITIGGIDDEFDKNVCGSMSSLLSGKLISIDNVIDKLESLVGSELTMWKMYVVCIFLFVLLYFIFQGIQKSCLTFLVVF